MNVGLDTIQIYLSASPNSTGITRIRRGISNKIEGDYLTLKISLQEKPRIYNSHSLSNSRMLINTINYNKAIDDVTLKIALQETLNYFSSESSKIKTAAIEIENRGLPFHYFILTTFNRQDSFNGNILIRFILTIHIIVSAFIAGYIANRFYKFFDKL